MSRTKLERSDKYKREARKLIVEVRIIKKASGITFKEIYKRYGIRISTLCSWIQSDSYPSEKFIPILERMVKEL